MFLWNFRYWNYDNNGEICSKIGECPFIVSRFPFPVNRIPNEYKISSGHSADWVFPRREFGFIWPYQNFFLHSWRFEFQRSIERNTELSERRKKEHHVSCLIFSIFSYFMFQISFHVLVKLLLNVTIRITNSFIYLNNVYRRVNWIIY